VGGFSAAHFRENTAPHAAARTAGAAETGHGRGVESPSAVLASSPASLLPARQARYPGSMAFRRLLPFLAILANGCAQTASTAPATLAVHVLVACSSQGAGQPARFPGVDASLCLDRTPFLTQKDVESAELHQNSQGHAVVFLTFHRDAAIRELDVTRQNAGRRVAIVVNGRVVAAPSIAASSRFLYIDARFTPQQAKALVAAFNRQAGNR